MDRWLAVWEKKRRHRQGDPTEMSPDPQAALKEFRPTKPFFVGIDSDGCAFNSMEVKHNDCFSVSLIRTFGLAAISRQVHQVWDFVNLYSQSRGCNRFKAIVLTFDLLRELPRVKRSGVPVPELPYVRDWIAKETTLGNPRLKQLVAESTGPRQQELARVLEWSHGIN